MAKHVACGNSQARGWIGAAPAGLHCSHHHSRSQAMSATYASAHGNTGSLTWERAGIKPTSSWTLHQLLNLLSPSGNSVLVLTSWYLDFLFILAYKVPPQVYPSGTFNYSNFKPNSTPSVRCPWSPNTFSPSQIMLHRYSLSLWLLYCSHSEMITMVTLPPLCWLRLPSAVCHVDHRNTTPSTKVTSSGCPEIIWLN